jgi:hypothetical protein
MLYFTPEIISKVVELTNKKGEFERTKLILFTNYDSALHLVTYTILQITKEGMTSFVGTPVERVDELYRYFAGFLMMVIIRLPKLSDYWTVSLGTDFYRKDLDVSVRRFLDWPNVSSSLTSRQTQPM